MAKAEGLDPKSNPLRQTQAKKQSRVQMEMHEDQQLNIQNGNSGAQTER
jgi:hypothetical protein